MANCSNAASLDMSSSWFLAMLFYIGVCPTDRLGQNQVLRTRRVRARRGKARRGEARQGELANLLEIVSGQSSGFRKGTRFISTRK